MNVSLAGISIGNTSLKLGAFGAGKLTWSRNVPLGDAGASAQAVQELAAAMAEWPDAPVLLASVNPPVTPAVLDLVSKSLPGRRVIRVEKDLPIPVGRQLDRESLVGEDRLLNAAAAYAALKQAVVVVDAGTAVTVDFVDGAGTFHGGAIAPGARLWLDSLGRGTAQLPEVEIARPVEAIGHNTAEAMRTAMFHGLRGMVRELVEQYAQAVGAFPMVVATGGSAEFLFKDYELVERIVPELTLMGLAATLQAEADADE